MIKPCRKPTIRSRCFDAGYLRKPAHCILKRLERYVFTRSALIVTERIVKIPDEHEEKNHQIRYNTYEEQRLVKWLDLYQYKPNAKKNSDEIGE